MKTIFFVRHGQSESSIGDLHKGPKVGLSKQGRRQAYLVARLLERRPIDIVIASTMQRAKETGDIIARRITKPIEYSDLFAERRWPSSSIGKSKDDPDIRRYENEFNHRLHESGWRFEDAENFTDLAERARQAIRYLESRREKNILVATHGTFLRVLLAKVLFGKALTGRECEQVIAGFITDNAGLTIFNHRLENERNQWTVETWNHHAHLN